MNVGKTVRIFTATLWVLFFLLYIAAKIDFFTQYFKLETAAYLHHHSLYWAGMDCYC